MHTYLSALIVLFAALLGGHSAFPMAYITAPRVDSPLPGQGVQGVVLVTGSTNVNGFQSAEFSFAHSRQDDGENNWFLIEYAPEPIDGDTLVVWDTTTIADGDYDLRVRVELVDGRTRDTVVSGIRVRNYTPLETSTPQAEVLVPTSTQAAQTQTAIPTPTDLPDNPLQLTEAAVNHNLRLGAAAGIGTVLLIGLYTILRRRNH